MPKKHSESTANRDAPLIAFVMYVVWGFGAQMARVDETVVDMVAMIIVVLGILVGLKQILAIGCSPERQRRLLVEEGLLAFLLLMSLLAFGL